MTEPHNVESATLHQIEVDRPNDVKHANEKVEGPNQPDPGGSASDPPEMRPVETMPPLRRQAWTLARSLADFVADGLKTVTAEQYHERLTICDACPDRRANRCLKCGCRLSLKARGRAFKCPAEKWPAVEDSMVENSAEE